MRSISGNLKAEPAVTVSERDLPMVDVQGIGTWRAPIVVASLLALTGLFFFPTLAGLHEKWTYWSGAYSHGYVILAISAWLLFRAADDATFGKSPSVLAGAALFLASSLWFLAWAAGILLIQALLLPLIVFLALCCLFGLSSWRQWAFPAAYLLFAIPLWDVFTPALQWLTIAVTSGLLDLANVTAYVEGSYVHVPAGTMEIALGCAGLHFFLSAFVMSCLYAYLVLKQFRNQVALVTFALLASVVMNWLRVTTIVLAGAATDMQHYLVTVDHYVYGWVLFTAAMIPVYLIARRLERREGASDVGGVARNHTVARVPWPRAALACVVMATGPAAAAVLTAVTAPPDATSIAAPESIGDWQRTAGTVVPLGIRFPGSLAQTEATYTRTGDARHLYLFANLYGRPRQGAELISSGNRLFDSNLWKTVDEDTLQVHDRQATVNAVRLRSRGRGEVLLIYWYNVAGQPFASDVEARLAEIRAVLGGVAGSGVRILAIECDGNCGDARDVLLDILEHDALRLVETPGDTETRT